MIALLNRQRLLSFRFGPKTWSGTISDYEWEIRYPTTEEIEQENRFKVKYVYSIKRNGKSWSTGRSGDKLTIEQLIGNITYYVSSDQSHRNWKRHLKSIKKASN